MHACSLKFWTTVAQAVEEAITNEGEALKRDITSDAMQLLRQVSADSQKHLGAMDDAIGTIQHEMDSITELKGVIETIKQREDIGHLLRGYRVLHNSVSDLITQREQKQQVVAEIFSLPPPRLSCVTRRLPVCLRVCLPTVGNSRVKATDWIFTKFHQRYICGQGLGLGLGLGFGLELGLGFGLGLGLWFGLGLFWKSSAFRSGCRNF